MHEIKQPLAVTFCYNTLANEKTLVKLSAIIHLFFLNLIQVSVKQLPYFLAERRVQQFNLAAIFVSLKISTIYLMVICCGSKNSSKSLFSCFHGSPVFGSFYGDAKDHDLIFSWAT